MSEQLRRDLESLRIARDDAARPPRSGAWVRTGVAVAVVAAVGAGAWVGWPHLEARLFKTEVDVGTILTVSPAQASTTLTSTGYVVARTLSRVAAKVPGRVSRVHVVEGQEVAVGDVLLELDAADQQSAIASARARVAAASARVVASRTGLSELDQQLARARSLAERGAGARASVEDLEARVASARSTIAASQAEVRAAQAEVEALRVGATGYTITAPIAGTVITEPVEVGEMVVPQLEVLQIADFGSMVVEVDVPEARLASVRAGGPCEIVLEAYPSRRLRGAVLELGRRVNRAKATVPVRVRFVDEATDVLPDMAARVSFLREELTAEQLRAAERVVVPAAAVAERRGQTIVWEIVDGVVRARSVRLGETAGDGRVLLDGPPPGTRVVLGPPATLADGQSVKERGRE